ncbi:response regulator [soil metagenome]
MRPATNTVTILIADDDADDRKLIAEAFREAKLLNILRFVEDGVEVFDYLNRRGKFADPHSSPWPSLLLLDLNMPRKDGREVLQDLKGNPRYSGIRVIVMTTSKSEADIVKSYLLNAASYITKPITFDGLVDVVATLGRYWFEIVELPEYDTPLETPALRG